MTDQATPAKVRLTDGLGPAPERAEFEAWKRKQGGHYMNRNNAPGSDLTGYQDAHTQGQWEAWQAARTAERERWAAVVRPLCAALEAGRTHRIEYMNAMDVLEGPNVEAKRAPPEKDFP